MYAENLRWNFCCCCCRSREWRFNLDIFKWHFVEFYEPFIVSLGRVSGKFISKIINRICFFPLFRCILYFRVYNFIADFFLLSSNGYLLVYATSFAFHRLAFIQLRLHALQISRHFFNCFNLLWRDKQRLLRNWWTIVSSTKARRLQFILS